MNTRLKIICILFGVIYLVMIGEMIYSSITVHKVESSDEYKREHDSASYPLSISNPPGFRVRPLKSNFPTMLPNEMTGKEMQFVVNSFKADLTGLELPAKLKITYEILTWGMLLVFVIMIYILVMSYKTIISIVRNNLFQMKNIRRIRRIGYACLFLFVYGFMHRLLSFLIVRSSISLEDYKITFSMSGYSYLITGLLVLLFAELLNISHRIKEENDLTI